jgi:hypothetical protein
MNWVIVDLGIAQLIEKPISDETVSSEYWPAVDGLKRAPAHQADGEQTLACRTITRH